jgi:hypothetical protein
MKTRISPLLFLFFASFCIACVPEETDPTDELGAPLSVGTVKTEAITDQYIVVLHGAGASSRKFCDGSANEAGQRKDVGRLLASHRISEGNVIRTYSSALNGFCARLSKEEVEKLKSDPAVKFIEQDRQGELGFGIDNLPWTNSGSLREGQMTPWGVKRVGGPVKYEGSNRVFVIDTGIDIDHPDLNVDSERGFDAYQFDENMNLNDEHGHGTHVAGIIGALDNNFGVVGVAAGVPLVPIKIFFGRRAAFTYSGMLAGVDHLCKCASPGDVANLSFGGFDSSAAMDEAVVNISESRKVWMVIAAGNSSLPATSYSPARVNGKYTITVSAIDAFNRYAWFSHFGFPIKFAAPGVNVVSTWINSTYSNQTGTSMAAPHVSALRLLGEIETDGYSLNYPISQADPIAIRKTTN